MGRAQKRKLERRMAREAGSGFVTNLNVAEHLPPDRSSWPLVRAYVPLHDAWQATGFGTAGVIRQAPGGNWSFACFPLSLMGGGMTSMFGQDRFPPAKVEELLNGVRDKVPPFQEGPADLAAEYIYGGWALAERQAQRWPRAETSRFLDLLAPPPGDESQWLARLTGPGGLTPPELLRVLRDNPEPSNLPDGKEIMILTTMTFALADAEAARQVLRRHSPTFQFSDQEGGEEVFNWTRPYPKGHSSPLSRLGGRQVLGSVRVAPEKLVADAQTLSMAAKLVGLLKDLLGERIRLQRTDWKGAEDLLAAVRR